MTETSDRDPRQQDQFTRRSLLLGGVQAAGLGLVGWRLFDLQVMGAHRYGPLAENNRLNLQVVAPKRGRILDRPDTCSPTTNKFFALRSRRHSQRTSAAFCSASAIFCRLRTMRSRRSSRGRGSRAERSDDGRFGFEFRTGGAPQSRRAEPSGHQHRIRVAASLSWRAALCHVVGFVGSVERFTIEDRSSRADSRKCVSAKAAPNWGSMAIFAARAGRKK